MKKCLSGAVSLLAVLLLVVGCKKPETKWDYPNTDITIVVRDANGKNVLDLSKPIKIIYNGETFPMKEIVLPTRAAGLDAPLWQGLRWNEYLGDNAMLLFGEFSVDTRAYHDESFTIHWGDGTSDEITFDLYATHDKGEDQPTVHEATRLNGVPNSDRSLMVNIVK